MGAAPGNPTHREKTQQVKAYLRLIRPHQWVKNFFVFIPMVFGGSLLSAQALTQAAWVWLAFSMAASSIYCLNDVVDAPADRRHPAKRNRPVASGRVSMRNALLLAALLFVTAFMLPLLTLTVGKLETTGVMAAYWLMNVAYCTRLKRYAILDVCIVAMGFVLRILAGGEATQIVPTHWLVLMTFLLSLFMSLAKRRDDVLRMEKTGEAPRANTMRYNLTFINQAITITASVTLVCYIMYTVSPEVTARLRSPYLYLTSIYVLLGLLRYLQIAVVDEKSGDPTKILLRDRPTQIIVAAWLATFLIIIYAT